MFENWFTNKCTALVGRDGKALTGSALVAAEEAIRDLLRNKKKFQVSRDNFSNMRGGYLFEQGREVKDANGNPIRICGNLIKYRAKFCNRCGSPAPSGWWRCPGCGKWIGNESVACPHCGKIQQPASRLNIRDGVWRKGDDVFAQRFELKDVESSLKNGLDIQEGQCAILLSGGAVVDVLTPGHLSAEDLSNLKYFSETGQRSFVMVDLGEIPFPVVVNKIQTLDDLEVDLRQVVVIRFNPDNAVTFMNNVMSKRDHYTSEDMFDHVYYKDMVHFILADTDAAVRAFCTQYKIENLFKNPKLRIELEDHIATSMTKNLDAIGVEFIRLKEVEFESALFDQFREKSGEIEIKRQEIEFMIRANELANDATRREAMSEQEMEEFMDQLAQEKQIKDELRVQELDRLRKVWALENAKTDLQNKKELAELEQGTQENFEIKDVIHDEKLKALALDGEIARQNKAHQALIAKKLEEQRASLEYEQIEVSIQEARVQAEQKAATNWLEIQRKKDEYKQQLEAKQIQSFKDADIQSLIATVSDPVKAERLMRLREMELQKEQLTLQSQMSPELLLAAAAAKGVPEAAEALSKMTNEQLSSIEREKISNTKVYEEALKMNERMFQAVKEIALKAVEQPQPPPPNNTTQIIK